MTPPLPEIIRELRALDAERRQPGTKGLVALNCLRLRMTFYLPTLLDELERLMKREPKVKP